MVVVVTAVWSGQLFIAGLPFLWIAILAVLSIVGLIGAYVTLPHVTHRIDSFLTPDRYANYQVQKSLEAFHSGGITGRGPGEGIVKQHLPDSHTDFIFAVAGEELGALVCLMIVMAYGFIVIRGMRRLYDETDLFTIYAVAGFLMQFGVQAMINMGVALNVLPTKGMTLPFISYGGSSMLGLAMTMGMMLALTRRRFGNVLVKPRIH
jgi:cell division protein FtsW